MTKTYKELLELKVIKKVSNIIFNMEKVQRHVSWKRKKKKQQISTEH